MLVGDIGGTKTQLALVSDNGASSENPPELQHVQYYLNDNFESFNLLLTQYLQEVPEAATTEHKSALSLCVAGPVQNNHCTLTNRPWTLDAAELSSQFGFSNVFLLNDLAATLYGVLNLPANDFVWLQEFPIEKLKNHSVISAGTGLGEANAISSPQQGIDNPQPVINASEGGHKNFAPSSQQELELLSFYMQDDPYVSVESFLSGEGLVRIHRYIVEKNSNKKNSETQQQLESPTTPAEITAAAGSDPAATESVALFTKMLLSEAGNLALQNLSAGGITIAGGIAPHILPFLQEANNLSAFNQKGKFSEWLSRVPLRVCTNILAPVYGAWYYARQNCS